MADKLRNTATRSARLETRVNPTVLALVKRAAKMQGRSVSEFVVAAAQDAAKRAMEETQIVRLSAVDQERFVDLLLNPPLRNSALKRARRAHAKLIAQSK